MVQHMVFPMFILGVVFVIALDMLDQGTVPVAKILPPLVAVRLSLHGKVNAELGLVVPAPGVSWLFPVMALGRVQCLKQCVGFMQRHLLAVFQMGAFTPNNCDNRLRRRVKGRLRGPGLCDLLFNPALYRRIYLSMLDFIAVFAKVIDKGNQLWGVVHRLGIVHNQPALPVA